MKPDVEFHTCRKSLMDGRRPLFTCVYAVHGLWEATKPFETAGPLQCCLGVLRAGIAGIAGIAGLTIGLLRLLARQLQERHRKTWKNQERCEKMCRLKMIIWFKMTQSQLFCSFRSVPIPVWNAPCRHSQTFPSRCTRPSLCPTRASRKRSRGESHNWRGCHEAPWKIFTGRTFRSVSPVAAFFAHA